MGANLSTYNKPNIRPPAQARKPVQTSEANDAVIIIRIGQMARLAFTGVDASADFWMTFDPTFASESVIAVLTAFTRRCTARRSH